MLNGARKRWTAQQSSSAMGYKVLLVNTYHYLRGGDSRHVLALAKLLSQYGNDVHFFAMKGENNLPCEDEEFFVSEMDYQKALQIRSPVQLARVLWRANYSLEARRKIANLLDRLRPNVVHLHSIRHHLTKSIIQEFKKRSIPMVWTLHDFKELCPNTSFFDGAGICEKCKGRKYLNVVMRRCKMGSFGASLLTYLETVVSNWISKMDDIDLYIAPSVFLRNQFIECGYRADSLLHLPNFLEVEEMIPHYAFNDYFVFIGRLETGKGVETMIRAYAQAQDRVTPMKLKIVGSGSKVDEYKQMAAAARANGLEFLGFKGGEELEEVTKKARAVIIPSELYENYPFSGLEAMAYGKPVIGARIGGIPEQVDDGVTGFLFEPSDDKELAEKMILLSQLPEARITEMGRRAREKVESNNNRYRYVAELLQAYEKVIARFN